MLKRLFRRRPLIEELEPRILFSADLAPVAVDALAPAAEQRVVSADGEFSHLASSLRNELVFVDASVKDYQSLLDDILTQSNNDRHIDVVVLDADRDGVEQISEALKQRDHLDAVHLITHGQSGQLRLGSTTLGVTELDARAADIKAWAASLNHSADLLLYGCDLASDAKGEQFVNTLSQLTGADVAASDDLTGGSAQGGDWILEYQSGKLETGHAMSAVWQQSWTGVLASVAVTTTNDVVDGNTNSLGALASNMGADGQISLREAIMAANGGGGADTITLAAGTYTLTLAGTGDDSGAIGDLDVTSEISIIGAGAASSKITVAGGWSDRIFHVLSSGAATVNFTNLTIAGGSGPQGGAIQIASGAAVALDHVILDKNTANVGGAINNVGSLTLTDVEIRDGGNGSQGGAIMNTGAAILTNVTIAGNKANTGGGIRNSGIIDLTNVTLSGNTAQISGGAIYQNGGGVNLTNVTIAANSAGTGGGIYLAVTNEVHASNTVFADNTGGNTTLAITSQGYNLDTDGSAGLGGTGDQSGVAAGLGPLANYGGFTRTHSLLAGSAAIDKANPATAPLTDQRGVARAGAAADVGAYEFTATGAAPAIVQNSLTINEGGNASPALTASDADTGAAGLTFVITGLSGGQFERISLPGIAISSFTQQELNDNQIRFIHNGAEVAPAYQVSVTDGTTTVGPQAATINFTKINDAPVGTDKTLTIAEDSSYTFTVADFGFTDPNDSPANSLLSVQIASLPTAGSLQYDGTPVTIGQSIGVSSIASGELKFLPALNASGASYASFTFQVQDNGGTANGGVNTDPTPNTIIVDVTAINDPPIGGYVVNDVIPQAQMTQATDGSGVITINWKGIDVESQNVTLSNFQYSDDGGLTWYTPSGGDAAGALSAGWRDNGGAGWTTATSFASASAHSFSFNTKHAAVTTVKSLQNADQNDIKVRFNLNDGAVSLNPATSQNFRVDNLAPSNVFNNSWYDVTTNTFWLSGTNFTTIAPVGTDIRTYMDWSRLVLDVNADGATTADTSFAQTEVLSLTIQSDAVMSMVLTNAKAGTIESNPNFGAAGGWDVWQVTAGFTGDAFGNRATSDGSLGSAPTISNAASGQSYVEDSAGVLLNPAISVGDTDSSVLSVTLTLSDASVGTLSAGTDGSVTATYNATSGVWSASGPIVNLNNLLANIVFTPSPGRYDTFTLTATVSDGVNAPVSVMKAMTGVPVNDAPAGTDKTVATLEDTVYVFTAADFGFSDSGDALPNSLLAIHIATLPAAGTLSNNGVAVTVGQAISAADIQAGKLTFTPAANANGTAYASFTFQVQDDGGSANGGTDIDATPNTISIDVTAVNDPPTNTPVTLTAIDEDSGPRLITQADLLVGAADTEGAALTAMNLSLSSGGGALNDNGNGSWTFTPAANWNGMATFAFTVSDGTASTANSASLTVNAIGDAPVANDDAAVGDEDTIISGNVLANDINVDGGILNATLIAGAANGTVVLHADGSYSYTPNANFNGSDSFTYHINNGALDSNIATVTIAINSVNDAPSGSDNIIATLENTPHIFAAADFGFADASDNPANSLIAVQISSLPSAGSLTWHDGVSDVAVTVGQRISALDIAAGKLKFTPATHGFGVAYASFTFQVEDDGGTANGAVDRDPVARTMTIDVAAVNTAPIATGVAFLAAIQEDDVDPPGATVSALFAANYSDPVDAGSVSHGQFAGIAVRGQSVNPTQGRWQYSVDGGASWNNFGLLSDANAVTLGLTDMLRFKPAADYHGEPNKLYVRLIDNSATLTAGASMDVSTHGGNTPISSATVPLSTHVNSVNDAPVIGAAANYEIKEGERLSVNLGAADVEGDTLLYAISGGADATLFDIDAVTGELSLKVQPDFDAPQDADGNNIYEVQVRASDANGGFADKAIAVAVTDKIDLILAPPAPVVPTADEVEPALPSAKAAEVPAHDAAAFLVTTDGASVPTNGTGNTAGFADGAPVASTSFTASLNAQPLYQFTPPKNNPAAAAPLLASLTQALNLLSKDQQTLALLQASLDNNRFLEQLNELQNELRQILKLDGNIVASSLAVSTGLSVGYVLWLVRGGVLLSSLLSSLPAWALIDPLPIMGHLKRRGGKDEQDDSLEGILKKSKRREASGKKAAKEEDQ